MHHLIIIILSAFVALTASAVPTTAFTVPRGLCAPDFHAKLFDAGSGGGGSADGTSFFIATSLCQAAFLTPNDNSAVPCKPKAFFRLVEYAKSNASTTDTTCGDVKTTLFAGLRVVNSTMDDVKEILLYHDEVGNATTKPANAKLLVTCAANATMMLDVTRVVRNAGVWTISAVGRCVAPPGTKAPNEAFFYTAVSVVLTLVLVFAGVLYRAKMAGDKLRELKRARGEKAFLG